MKTEYNAVNLTLRDPDRSHLEQELEKIGRSLQNFADPVAHVQVERSARKGGFGVSLHIALPTRSLFATAWGGDLRSAIELVSDKVNRQARKHVEILRREQRAGAESLRHVAETALPTRKELEEARDFEDFCDHVAHHAARLAQVLKRERRLDGRIRAAGGSISLPDITEEALAYVFEHFREKPAEMSPDRWLVRRGLLILDAELERVQREATGEGEAPPVAEPQEDWEEVMDLPVFMSGGMEMTPAEESRTSPPAIQDRQQAQQATAEALKNLPPLQRKALVLRHLEGYKLPEIAYVLNSNETQVDDWLNEAEVRMQERLKKLGVPADAQFGLARMDYLQPGDFFAVAAAFSWALAVVLFKRCGETIAPLPLNLFKNTLALVFFLPAAALLEDGIPPPDVSWLYLAFSGVAGITLADTFFFSALNRLGAGMNAVVDCFYAPSMILTAMVLLGDTLSPEQTIGGSLVVSAIILGSKTKPIPGRTSRDLLTGILFGACGMVLMAVSIVSVKQFMSPERIIWITTARLFWGTLALVPVIALRREWAKTARIFRPSRLWKVALPASFIGTVMAMAFWVAGLTLNQVSRAAILNQLSTIFIFILAAVILKERITRRRAGAVALAFAGAVLTLWRW